MKSLLWSEDEFLQKVSSVPLQSIDWNFSSSKFSTNKEIEILVRRDDLIDPHLSGNKLYKLYYNLLEAERAGVKTLVSFGGAYSNHLHALAAAGNKFGFRTLGLIRGDATETLSPTLADAKAWGMEFVFVSRTAYDEKTSQEFEHDYLDGLRKIYGDYWLIPEGGANHLGAKGARLLGLGIQQQLDLRDHSKADYTAVCLACGTGTTLAGVTAGLENTAGNKLETVGFSVLKGAGDLGEQIKQQIVQLNSNANRWRLISGFHCGGYAKKLPDDVKNFMRKFERETEILLDPVYTVKLFWAVTQLAQQDYWPRSSRLVLIHSGGLQGRRGFSI